MANTHEGLEILEEVNNSEIEVEKLAKRKGMNFCKEIHRRTYGPPIDYKGREPPKECEVFIKIPRDAFEPELIPIFEQAGKIYKMRIMTDSRGSELNRGFAFVKFVNSQDAEKAVATLNNLNIRPNDKLRVRKFMEHRHLFIAKIPNEKTQVDIFEEINRITRSVVGVIVFPDPDNRLLNRGYVYVEYRSHKAACLARTRIIFQNVRLWGERVMAQWARNNVSGLWSFRGNQPPPPLPASLPWTNSSFPNQFGPGIVDQYGFPLSQPVVFAGPNPNELLHQIAIPVFQIPPQDIGLGVPVLTIHTFVPIFEHNTYGSRGP